MKRVLFFLVVVGFIGLVFWSAYNIDKSPNPNNAPYIVEQPQPTATPPPDASVGLITVRGFVQTKIPGTFYVNKSRIYKTPKGGMYIIADSKIYRERFYDDEVQIAFDGSNGRVVGSIEGITNINASVGPYDMPLIN